MKIRQRSQPDKPLRAALAGGRQPGMTVDVDGILEFEQESLSTGAFGQKPTLS